MGFSKNFRKIITAKFNECLASSFQKIVSNSQDMTITENSNLLIAIRKLELLNTVISSGTNKKLARNSEVNPGRLGVQTTLKGSKTEPSCPGPQLALRVSSMSTDRQVFPLL